MTGTWTGQNYPLCCRSHQGYERAERKVAMSVRNLAMAAGALFVSLAVVPMSPLYAQAKAPKPKANLKADSLQADTKFLHDASADHSLVIRLGQMAERKATRPDVKQFGQRMVTDHSKLEDQLQG